MTDATTSHGVEFDTEWRGKKIGRQLVPADSPEEARATARRLSTLGDDVKRTRFVLVTTTTTPWQASDV